MHPYQSEWAMYARAFEYLMDRWLMAVVSMAGPLCVCACAASADAGELSGGKPIPVARKAFVDLQVIDHHNLRRDHKGDQEALAAEVAQIKRNMDVAAPLGFTSYLLFQEEAFPELLTWGGKHQPDEDLRRAVGEVLEYAKLRGLKLYLHCNEFMWPASVGVPYGDTPEAWNTYGNALKELIGLYPDLAGFQVTADETSGALQTREGVLRFHNETARALVSDGRERLALMRTWQRTDVLGSPETFGRGDAPNVLFSVKNTSGDFNIANGFDREFFDAVAEPGRLLVEFDAWREYETHNVFPLYLGDYWAPRFRALARAGVKRIGVRFNWNSGRMPITERPWANWVNVFCFARFAENPQTEPDAILREFVTLYYPPEARQAALDVYRGSFDYARALYYRGQDRISDHGRVNRPGKAKVKLDTGWMRHVDDQLGAMLAKIDALPEGGPYKDELRRGAMAVAYASKAMALTSGAPGDASFLATWRFTDLESFEELRGELALRATRPESLRTSSPVQPSDAPARAR